MLEAGIRGEQSVAVTSENTAKTMGSGTLDVFATPALVALAEKTCWMSVAAALDEGCGTVGTRLELEHSAPTPVGMTVTCESELTAVEGRKLVFKVSLHDEKGPVGTSGSSSTTPSLPQRQRAKRGNGLALSVSAVGAASSPKGGAFGIVGRLAVHIQRLSVLFHHLRFRLLLGGGQQADGLFVGAEQLKIQRFIIRRGGGPLSVCNRDSLPRAGTKNQVRNHL